MMKYSLVFLIVFLTRLLTCAAPAGIATDTDEALQPPYRNSVRRAALRAPEWQLVYSAKTEAERAQLRALLTEVANKKPLDKHFTVLDLAEATTEQLGKMPLLIIGNDLPAAVVERTEKLEADGTYNGIQVLNAGDMLQLRYIQNPWSAADTTLAMNLIYGPDLASLLKQVNKQYSNDWNKLFWNSWDYEIDQGEKPRQKGSFIENGWLPNEQTTINFGDETTPVYTNNHWKIIAIDGTPDQAKLAALAKELSRARESVDSLFTTPRQDTATVYVYPSVERIGLRRQNMELVQFDAAEQALHLVMAASRPVIYGPILEYQLLQWQRAVSQEKVAQELDFIEAGLAVRSNVHFSATYRRMGIALAKTSKLLDQQTLSNRENREQRGSYLYDISAAAWIDAVLGVEKTRLTATDLATLQSQATKTPTNWQAIVAKQALAPYEKIMEPTGFRKGMTFAHEGYRVYNGYGGSTVEPSLDSLAALKVNALSIVPYTFLQDKNTPGDLPNSDYAGGENDQAVSYSIQRAHARGWSVMLKPQIWVGNGWPGDINFTNQTDWDKFFARYTEWIAHYAIMAQLEGVDALCIGTEMVRTTIDHPKEWRKIIALLRNLYGGRLTYAANWGEEFEQLTFWDDLDAIGLNSYYPLSTKEEPTNEELLEGAKNWVSKAEAISQKFDKPWWLTEVGFRSVKRAWLNPHAEANERPASLECQQRCFNALVTASNSAQHLAGMYIWKWPSYLGYGRGRNDPGTEFAPGGKPAAEELRQFYGDR